MYGLLITLSIFGTVSCEDDDANGCYGTNLVFFRGDANDDGQVDQSDAIAVLNHINSGGTVCTQAADANWDGDVDISDAIYLLSYLNAGGPAPTEPCVARPGYCCKCEESPEGEHYGWPEEDEVVCEGAIDLSWDPGESCP